ncbi:MAG: hypothetical protein K2X66_05115, partial [Cyanobacteria bacterium]|nr:hypothetical protein [Cyanobacteriota bacterium]
MNLLTERNHKVLKPLTQKTMAEEMKSLQSSVDSMPGNRLPLASLNSHQDLFTPSLQFQGAKSISTSKASVKGPSGFERLAHFKLPVAMLGVFGSGLGNLAMAAVTPESEKLVKTLDSKDENLVETALVNLGNINERDALPFVKKILSEAKASEDTLNAAMKAAGLLGAKSNEAEKAELSKLIMPYLQKVVLQDKDKNNTFLFFDQIQPEMIDKDTKVKDVGFASAKALGQIGHGATVSQLSKAAQDPSLGKDVRYLALEAIKNSPANPAIDKEMIGLLDKLDPTSEGPLVAQVLQVIVKHNVSDGWTKIEKMFEEKVSTPASTTPAPGAPKNQAPTPTPKELQVSSSRKGIAPQRDDFRMRNTDGPSAIQSAAIQAVLSQKKPESSALVMKQMAKYPDFFRRLMPQMVEYVKAMPLETKKELLSWVDAGASEKAALAANPKKANYDTPADERKDEQKIRMNGMKLRQMAVVLTALAKVPNAGAEYQKIYTNSFENPGFRSLGVAAATFVKDASAIPSLMALGADDTEDVDLRYDAIAGSMEILVPPPAKGLESNIDRANFMERYLTTFTDNEQFTKSFFKAEMFNEIREVRKALIKANAPLKDLDEATLKIVDKRIKTMGLSSEMKKALLASPQAKDIERKMLDYVSKKQNADGFLRIMMVGALGQMESKDAKAVMKELVSDPLVRTKIPDVASSNDMMMFPGYTKQTIASNTRLAAVQSMGKTGNMDEAEFLEKALRSDDRRLHITALSSIEEIGQRTGTNGNPLVDPNPAVEARRTALADRMLRAMPKVNMNASARMDNHVKKLYAQAIDKLGGGEKLLALMDKTSDTVLKRAIANGLIKNDKYLDNPKVSQHLLAMSLGVDQLHKMGIDGRGTEIAILDGDYLNDDIPGVEGKVVYPEWGNLKEASLRTSFH